MQDAETDQSSPRPGPRREIGRPAGPDAVRRAILDAAADLFARRGVDAVPLRDIASAADVQLALIARYIGKRAELIDAVFHDLSSQLAQELLDKPLAMPTFDRDSTMGRWLVVLTHLVISGSDPPRLADAFNPVSALAEVIEDNWGLEPSDARIRGAQIAAHALGWRLFESYLIVAGDLESIPLETLRDEYTALNRRIGATPLRAERDSPLNDS